jgi:hypothetical protein
MTLVALFAGFVAIGAGLFLMVSSAVTLRRGPGLFLEDPRQLLRAQRDAGTGALCALAGFAAIFTVTVWRLFS